MATKVTIDTLDTGIQKILDKYGEDVTKNIDEVAKKVANKAKQAIQSASGIFGGTGRYAKGWAVTAETGRMSTKYTIHNKSVPGLPHLLENGHAKRGGGRVAGRTHIAPVETEVIESFTKAVEEAAQK